MLTSLSLQTLAYAEMMCSSEFLIMCQLIKGLD
jgi:hypothetical protein